MDLRSLSPYKDHVKSTAICLWGLRHAIKRASLWIVLGISLLIVPLSHAMSPFTQQGLDTAWKLAEQWGILFGMLGTSLGVLFLSRQEEFLRMLATPTRWKGEWGTLIMANVALQLPLAIGAAYVEAQAGGALDWIQSSLLTAAIVSCGGFVALRVQASASTRVLYLWIFLWGLPGLLA
jgi:hypothetical protein